MHCPNCRHDNALTTRFCTSCGAVLVESTPDGRRRRVLRPWGLGRSAPPTVSPDMPELVAAARGDARRLSRRLDVKFAAGTVVVAVAGTFLYPYARTLDAPPVEQVAPAEPAVVTTTSSYAVRETVVASPPLVEPVKPKTTTLVTVTPREHRDNATTARSPSAPAMPVRLEPIVAAGPVPMVVAQAAPIASPRDRWQPLKDALARCASRSGLLERATCEQGARIAHCDGAWGEAALCPAGRTDFGQ